MESIEKGGWQVRYCKAIIALFILAVIPMIAIAFYDHPSADDFSICIVSGPVWQETHSLIALTKSAVQQTVKQWRTWSGLYTARFFQSYHPTVFGEQCYAIGAILMLMFLILSSVITAWYFVQKVLGGSRLQSLFIAAMMSFAILEWMPSPVEGIYWYNGAANYAPYQASLMAIVCLMAEIIRSSKKTAWRRVVKLSVITAVLSAYHCGGNQLCAFAGVLAMFAFLIGVLYTKDKRLILTVFILFCVIFAFFCLNVLSPGTRLRSALFEYKGKPNTFESMEIAVQEGRKSVIRWTSPRILCLLLLSLPVIVPLVRQFCRRTAFNFRLPVIVLVLSVGWVCALFCPPIYAQGGVGGGRVWDYIYYSYIMLLFFNTVYLIGFLIKSGIAGAVKTAFCTIGSRIIGTKAGGRAWSAVQKVNYKVLGEIGGFVLLAVVIVQGENILRAAHLFCKTTSTARAVGSIISGSAKRYSDEHYERIKLYKLMKGQDVIVKPFSERPGLLVFFDFTADPDYWTNQRVAKYYGLKSVRLNHY